MDTSYNYVLVTKEESNVRVPKVLEDYLYSLHIFSDVISLENFTVERFRQSNSIYVITQMWLNIDENDRYFINEVLSSNRVVFLNVEMLSEEIRMKHIINLLKYKSSKSKYLQLKLFTFAIRI